MMAAWLVVARLVYLESREAEAEGLVAVGGVTPVCLPTEDAAAARGEAGGELDDGLGGVERGAAEQLEKGSAAVACRAAVTCHLCARRREQMMAREGRVSLDRL